MALLVTSCIKCHYPLSTRREYNWALPTRRVDKFKWRFNELKVALISPFQLWLVLPVLAAPRWLRLPPLRPASAALAGSLAKLPPETLPPFRPASAARVGLFAKLPAFLLFTAMAISSWMLVAT